MNPHIATKGEKIFISYFYISPKKQRYIYLIVSHDAGKTWSQPKLVIQDNHIIASINYVLAISSSLMVIYERWRKDLSVLDYYGKQSVDDGNSFSPEVRITSFSDAFKNGGRGFLTSGSHTMFLAGEAPDHNWLRRSTNGGLTWQKSSYPKKGRIVKIVFANGRLHAVTYLRNYYYQFSKDDGINWSTPVTLVENTKIIFRHIGFARGHLFIIFKEGAYGYRKKDELINRRFFLIHSQNEGATWSLPDVFTSFRYYPDKHRKRFLSKFYADEKQCVFLYETCGSTDELELHKIRYFIDTQRSNIKNN